MESISRISTLLESARELTLDAAQAARSSRGATSITKTMTVPQVKKLLDSRNEREILEGLRKVIAMMYRAQNCLPFFSSIVKNVASPHLEIKKLVYIYLVSHAEREPDLALLSINTIQKSLSDTNPQIRALALKTMASLPLPVISQIVSLAIKKGLGDMSPHVRKAAALAIPKCFKLDPSTLPVLLEYLAILLGDKQYYVAGAACKAWLEIAPDRIDMIHGHYRSLVKKAVDMDEWSQLAFLQMIMVYARKCFPRRTRKIVKKGANKGFYDDEVDESQVVTEIEQILDADLDLLLKTIRPLLQSRNSAVVIAVTRCYVNLGTTQYIQHAIGPLISLLRGPQDIQAIALYNLVSVALTTPSSFTKYATRFLMHSSDSPQIQELKLELLTLIFPYCDAYIKSLILNELEHFSQSSDKILVRESVRAIGRCAQGDPKTSARCLRLLLRQITSLDGNLVSESLTVVRHLIQQDPGSHTSTVIRLARNLDTATNANARATIIWLVGEFAGIQGENNIAADVLRILARGFAGEDEITKLQIVLLAAKVYLHHLNATDVNESTPQAALSYSHSPKITTYPAESGGFGEMDDRHRHHHLSEPSQEASDPASAHPIVKLWHHILLLARYDTSYDLRDRSRLYKALLSVPSSTQLASLMLLAPKPVPHTPSPSESRKAFTLGSASLVVGEDAGGVHGLRGYEALPDWVIEGQEPEQELRNVGFEAVEYGEKRIVAAGEMLDGIVRNGKQPVSIPIHSGSMTTNGIGKEKTLDDWLAESEDETDDSGEEEDTADEEDEDFEEEEEEEEEDDDDDDDDDAENEDVNEIDSDEDGHERVALIE